MSDEENRYGFKVLWKLNESPERLDIVLKMEK